MHVLDGADRQLLSHGGQIDRLAARHARGAGGANEDAQHLEAHFGAHAVHGLVREHRKERVLIVSHQVIVNCFRYLLDRLDEQTILAIDRSADVPNCSVTSYEFEAMRGKNGKLVAQLVNFVAPLREAGTPVTAAPDIPVAPKS